MARMLGKSNTFEVYDEQRSTYKWTAPEAAIQKKYIASSQMFVHLVLFFMRFSHVVALPILV